MKSYKIQLPGFFYFLFYISFDISRYHFYNLLEFYSALSEKNFCPKFLLFKRIHPPLPNPNPLMPKIC